MNYVFYDPTFQKATPCWTATNPPHEHVDLSKPVPSECSTAFTFWLGASAVTAED